MTTQDKSFGKADEKWIDDYIKNGKNDKDVSDYSPEPISATIMKAVDWISKYKLSQLSGDAIAEFIYKLSVLRVNLGQELAQAIGEAEWEKKLNLNRTTLWQRLYVLNWDINKAINY